MFLSRAAAAECVWCTDMRIYPRANKSPRSEVCKVSLPHLTHTLLGALEMSCGRARARESEAWANQKVLLPLPETRFLSASPSHAAPPVPRHFNKGKCLRCAATSRERKSQIEPFACSHSKHRWDARELLHFWHQEQIFIFRLICHCEF